VSPLRFGAADQISIRPLLHGLLADEARRDRVAFETPSAICDSVERGRYDAALVPAIEYLRGIGHHLIAGPALVARTAPGGATLVAQKPVDELKRIAVGEFCRTPVAALRIVLAELNAVFPDLLVEKRIDQDDWRDHYDAVLLTGNAALRESLAERTRGLTRYNLAQMWKRVAHAPLVHAVWVYEEAKLGDEIAHLLIASRDEGLDRLTDIADRAAAAMNVDRMAIYDHLTRTWAYQLGEVELEGLHALNDLARKYDLVRENRLENLAAA
jgi:predicted solute-binding protein